MQHYTDWVTDAQGNALSGATVTVYDAGTTNLSTIYSDNGVTPTGNPITTGTDGNFDFYAADGRYDLVFAKSGYTFVAADTAGMCLYDVAAGVTTWVPSVGGTATYTKQNGYAIKRGSVVTVWCDMVINAIGTGSATTISGLPYTVNATMPGICAVRFISLSQNVVYVTAYATPNSTIIILNSLLAAGASEGSNNIIGSGYSITFTMQYTV